MHVCYIHFGKLVDFLVVAIIWHVVSCADRIVFSFWLYVSVLVLLNRFYRYTRNRCGTQDVPGCSPLLTHPWWMFLDSKIHVQ